MTASTVWLLFLPGNVRRRRSAQALIDLVSRVVKQLTEKIAISGHTDSVPFFGQANYSNWDLSADRALATRRALLESGVPADRVKRVIGSADTEPLLADDPANAGNRRIRIVLLRDTPPVPVVNVPVAAAKAGQIPASLRSGDK